MRRDFDSHFVEQFADGAARAFFVSSWADEMEEQGKTFSGKDLMDVAPATPLSAYVAAGELIGRLEAANNTSIEVLGDRAARADGTPTEDLNIDEFGHYMAMEAMGHGVSWFDDHARFQIEVPYVEYHWYKD